MTAAKVMLPEGQPEPRQRWLLVSDASSLKTNAVATYGQRYPLRATRVLPAHVDCANTESSLLETLAELALLAESDVLLHGASAFADVAVMLCRRCKRALRLQLDPKCPVRSGEVVPIHKAWPRCFGDGGRYSATEEIDAEGRIVSLSAALT